jgi:hypothetical protein
MKIFDQVCCAKKRFKGNKKSTSENLTSWLCIAVGQKRINDSHCATDGVKISLTAVAVCVIIHNHTNTSTKSRLLAKCFHSAKICTKRAVSFMKGES